MKLVTKKIKMRRQNMYATKADITAAMRDREFAQYYSTHKFGDADTMRYVAKQLIEFGFFVRDKSMASADPDRGIPQGYQFSAFLPGDKFDDPDYALLGVEPCVVDDTASPNPKYARIYVLN